MANVILFATRKRDAGQLDRVLRKAGFVVGTELETLRSVAEKEP